MAQAQRQPARLSARPACADAGDAVDVLIRSSPRQAGRKDETRITVAGALFDGRLVVKDADRIRDAMAQGIGPGKAFGFGLLSLGPDR